MCATLAGGHNLESNVLDLRGAESATHDLFEAHRIENDRDAHRVLVPEFVLVMSEGLSRHGLCAFACELRPRVGGGVFLGGPRPRASRSL